MLDQDTDKKDEEQQGGEKKPDKSDKPPLQPNPAVKPKLPINFPPVPNLNTEHSRQPEKIEPLVLDQIPVSQLARILKESGVLNALRNSFPRSTDAPQLEYAQNSKEIISWITNRIENSQSEEPEKIEQLKLKFEWLEKTVTGTNCAQAAKWIKKHFPSTESNLLEAYRIAAHLDRMTFNEDLWKMDFVPKYPEILDKTFSIEGKLSPSAAFMASLSNVHQIPDARLKDLCELTYSTFPEVMRGSPEALLIISTLANSNGKTVNDGRIQKGLIQLRNHVNSLRDDFGFSSIYGADIVHLSKAIKLNEAFAKQLTPETGKLWKQLQGEFPQLYNRDLQDLLTSDSDSRKYLNTFDSLRNRPSIYPREAILLVRSFGREPRDIPIEEWRELGGKQLPVPLESILAQPLFSSYVEMALQKFKGIPPQMNQLLYLAENFLGYEVAHTKSDLSQTLAVKHSVQDYALSGGLFKMFRDSGMENVTYNFTNHMADEMLGAKLSLQEAAKGVMALLEKGMGPQFQETYRILVEELGMKEVPLPNLLMIVSKAENLQFLLNKDNQESYKQLLSQVSTETGVPPTQGENFNIESMRQILSRRDEFLAELPRLKKSFFDPEFTAADGIEGLLIFAKGKTPFAAVVSAMETFGKMVGSTEVKDYMPLALAAAVSSDQWLERIELSETKGLWELV